MALTAKQKTFVQEYLIDLNATRAAIRAGYSERTACEQGARLLANVKVQRLLQESMKKREQRTAVSQDYVIGKLLEITEKQASDFPESDLKYSSKLKALELLGKHVGAWEPKTEPETLKTAKALLGGIDSAID
ncbi:terminase small subunit [Clostridiaceae bacterium]|nr:terminase small subunit [Clostridiaceae bacterium]